jgi:hypothetical protein
MAVVQSPSRTSGTPGQPDPTDADLLFREAKQRERRRRLAWLGVAVIVVGGAVALVAATRTRPKTSPHRAESSRNKTPLPGVAAGQFAATWHVHTFYVYIRTNGQGSAMWPIHVDCGSPHVTAGAPCDTVTPETVLVQGVANTVDAIHDGGRAVIRIASVNGARARAVISASTEPSVLPDGDATLTVTKSDLLYVTPAVATTSSPFGRSGFCGPRAAALSLSQQEAAHINCGA